MKTIPSLLLAATALWLAACSGGGNAAAGQNLMNDIAVEPEANLTADLPVEAENIALETNAAPAAPEAVEPAPAAGRADTRSKAAERTEPAAPPKQEADPHAGHDMGNMTHN